MCRWLAYSGSPVLLEEILIKPTHSLIDQSLHSTLGAETTNGDGFGLGWYGTGEGPGVYPPTFGRPPAARSSRRTAIRSGTDAGSGCTTA
jgi:predicted glutamine amidotransferase